MMVSLDIADLDHIIKDLGVLFDEGLNVEWIDISESNSGLKPEVPDRTVRYWLGSRTSALRMEFNLGEPPHYYVSRTDNLTQEGESEDLEEALNRARELGLLGK